MQNRYIGNVDLGFNKENVLEVRLSMGAALKKGELFKARLLESPAIRDVSFSEFKFVSDESRSFIGYNYKGQQRVFLARSLRVKDLFSAMTGGNEVI